ncbi:hypothetical protein M1437_00275 [Patescibacteria group bacterium]|nr:hypothetical protein [Patescibacteria group bacterium]
MFVEKGSSVSVFRKAKRIFQRVSGAAVVVAGSFLAGNNLIVRADELLYDDVFFQCSGSVGLEDYLPWGHTLLIGVRRNPEDGNLYRVLKDYKYNPGQCDTVLGHIPPELWPAMDLLASNPRVAKIARALYNSDAEIVFSEKIDTSVYTINDNRILINSQLKTASPQRLAVALVHEGQHLVERVKLQSEKTMGECLDSEVRAWDTSSAFWKDLYGPSGSEFPSDEMEASLNTYLQESLDDAHMLVYFAYAGQCSQYPLEGSK